MDASGFKSLLAGILRSKLYDIKATYSTTSQILPTRLVTSAYDAVMTMGRELKPEFVEGKQQLLEGRRCPRCLQPQHRIRIVRIFEGRVTMYSCMECKHMISMQVERPPEVVNTNAGSGTSV